MPRKPKTVSLVPLLPTYSITTDFGGQCLGQATRVPRIAAPGEYAPFSRSRDLAVFVGLVL